MQITLTVQKVIFCICITHFTGDDHARRMVNCVTAVAYVPYLPYTIANSAFYSQCLHVVNRTHNSWPGVKCGSADFK